jgi:hypothetical protein
MKTLLIALLFISLTTLCFAQRDMQQNELKYNPMEKTWSYEKPNAQLQYNPFENKWDYGRPETTPLYNPFTNKWEIQK